MINIVLVMVVVIINDDGNTVTFSGLLPLPDPWQN